jgi:arginase
MGTLAGLTRARGTPPGLVWVDAHADINSPTSSPTGNVHGMPLYFALRNGFAQAERTVQIGLRDVDPAEKRLLREFGVTAFTMSDIDKVGVRQVMEAARAIAGAQDHRIHVSFDMDAIDPSEAPGTGTPVKGGLSYREAHLVMEMLYDGGQLGSLEMVEINPIFDDRNQTASLAVGLICSALGKSIL